MGPLSLLRRRRAVERAPAARALKIAIHDLVAKTWTHPTTGRDLHFSAVTIERWYYTARRGHDDPVAGLRRAVRKDCGKVSLATALAERLRLQYHDRPHWSYQLHYDNLAALVKAEPALGPLHSYATVRRCMKAHGWVPRPRPHPKPRPGEERAEIRRQTREVRSYEAAYVGSLWHLDFHSMIAATCGLTWGRTASTNASGTGRTGSDSLASERPFLSPATATKP